MPETPNHELATEDHYLTLAGPSTTEIKVKRSRFIALANPVSDAQEARSWIKTQERKYHDARHVCYAWRTGHHENIREIRSDAGEPSGTAGEPLLGSLRKAGACDAMVVVVRYFGGIKLGTGGLARAYTEAAEKAVEQAGIRTILVGRQFAMNFPYTLRKTVAHLLSHYSGEVRSEAYTDEIQWQVWLPVSRCGAFTAAVKESSSGTIHPREIMGPELPA